MVLNWNVLFRGSIPALAVIAMILGTSSATAQDLSTPLILHVTPATVASASLLSGETSAWTVKPAEIHLNRTPPLFETDPRDNGVRPTTQVQLQRADSSVFVRLVWSDSSADTSPVAARYPDAGDFPIYKKQSEVLDRFPDAACVMVPKQAGTGPLPSLMMGDQTGPVWLYYWRNGRGFERLEAVGRGSTTAKGQTFIGSSKYINGHWEIVFELPSLPAGTPLAFAIWNGSQDQRDGLKFYSLWFEVM